MNFWVADFEKPIRLLFRPRFRHKHSDLPLTIPCNEQNWPSLVNWTKCRNYVFWEFNLIFDSTPIGAEKSIFSPFNEANSSWPKKLNEVLEDGFLGR